MHQSEPEAALAACSIPELAALRHPLALRRTRGRPLTHDEQAMLDDIDRALDERLELRTVPPTSRDPPRILAADPEVERAIECLCCDPCRERR